MSAHAQTHPADAAEESAADFVERLWRRGVRLTLHDGQLRYEATSEFTGAEIAELRRRKPDVIQHLLDGAQLRVARRDREAAAPLSYAQERLWVLDRMGLTGSAYNTRLSFALFGPLERHRFIEAVQRVVSTHAALRTRFADTPHGPQQSVSPMGAVDVAWHDFLDRRAEADAHLDEVAAAPFDLTAGRLFRACVARVAPDEHWVLLSMHHICTDGWSMSLIATSLAAAYRGEPPAFAAIDYADYAVWQRAREPELERDVDYWAQRLDGAPLELELPLDFPRPAMPSHRGSVRRTALDVELLNALRTVANAQGATLFMTLLAAFKVTLWRWTGAADLVVGTPVAGRTHRELEDVVGLFVNMLPVRTTLRPEEGFDALLRRFRDAVLDDISHQEAPFAKIVERVSSGRSLARHPAFQVAFVLQNLTDPRLDLPGLQARWRTTAHATAQFDLTLMVHEAAEGLEVALEYAHDLFTAETIERLLVRWTETLRQAARAPHRPIGDLAAVHGEERELLLAGQRSATRSHGPETIGALFSRRAGERPDAIAVSCNDETLTYADLDARAEDLAQALRRRGVGRESVVGVCLERSSRLVIALLAVIKAGGAYLALDPRHPDQRLRLLLEDSCARLVLTDGTQASRFSSVTVMSLDGWAVEGEPEPTFTGAAGDRPSVEPGNLAYVTYTSGSTGRPKGVAVTHVGVTNLVINPNFIDISGEDVFLQLAPLAFDASTFEIWGALLNGARLAIYPETTADPRRIGEVLAREGVTILWLTAGLFHEVLEAVNFAASPLRCLLAGGDVVSPADVRKLLEQAPDITFVNGYGPTECTTFAACHPATADAPPVGAVPIGRPVQGAQAYVLDEGLELVPIGAPGDLYVAGSGLARGYAGAPGLTAERFIACPFASPGARMYATGDRVRWRSDGRLEFLGRRDKQIKLRGFRIEPAEVEAGLASCPGVEQAAAVVRHTEAGEPQLVAYVTGDAGLIEAELRRELRRHVPEHLVPARIVRLARLPTTAIGKLDRRALEAMTPAAPVKISSPPLNGMEEVIHEIWCAALDVDRLDVHADFFEAGGHSLLATSVINKINRALSLEVSLREIFEHPTIRTLSESLLAQL